MLHNVLVSIYSGDLADKRRQMWIIYAKVDYIYAHPLANFNHFSVVNVNKT